MLSKLKIFFISYLLTTSCFAEDCLEKMTLEEQVGQLFITHFHGGIANEEARILIQEVKVGGIIYYNWSNGLTSPSQVRDLSLSLQELAAKNPLPIPLLIATDQEGGVVSRLTQGFTQFPGNRAIAEAGDFVLAKSVAEVMAQEMKAVGININFAPLVDVNSNPRNPVIGIRSFGENPELVVAFAKETLKGYKQLGLIATLKHFPGHGDVEIDSHQELPIVSKSLKKLEAMDLLPFAQLASLADCIMTAHILVPALDPDNCATLSKKTLDYLKNKIGFQGIIIADSLVMEGVLKTCHSVDEAAIQALIAGCDILLLGGKQLNGVNSSLELTSKDVKRIQHSIVNAVKRGRIPEERINQAVKKIIQLKQANIKSELCRQQPFFNSINNVVHKALAQKIADLALTMKNKKPKETLYFSKKNVQVFAPQILKENINQTSLLNLGETNQSYFFNSLNPTPEEMETALKYAQDSDICIMCCYNAWKNLHQLIFMQKLSKIGKPLILLVTRDPIDADFLPETNFTFVTYSPVSVSLQAVCKSLFSLDNKESL